ncbi:MAG: protein kinase [Cyanobacteria bacterium P01_D01_bin.73]
MSTSYPKHSHCLNDGCRSPINEFGRDRCQDCMAHLRLGGRFRLGERLWGGRRTGTSLTLVVDEANPDAPPRLLKLLHRSDPHWQQQFRWEAELLWQLSQSTQRVSTREFATQKSAQKSTMIEQSPVPYSDEGDWIEPDWQSGLGGTVGVVMDYLPGRSLAEELRQNGPIPWSRLAVWLPQLIQLVYFLHRRQVIHGDIKPDNFLLCGDRLHIIDFGAAGFVGDRPPLAQSSPGYCPAAITDSPLTYQRDWYALGRTCVQLLTGQHPIELIRCSEFQGLLNDHSCFDWRLLEPQMSVSLGQRMNAWMSI